MTTCETCEKIKLRTISQNYSYQSGLAGQAGGGELGQGDFALDRPGLVNNITLGGHREP